MPYPSALPKNLFIMHKVKTVSAGVKIDRRRHDQSAASYLYARAPGKQFKKIFSKKSHSAENESFHINMHWDEP